MLSKLMRYAREPLYKNSFFIGLSRVFNAACGFFFWLVAARYYSVADVGIATALISSLGLVMTFSRFGFDVSLIRFMPLNDKNKVFNTCLWITTLSAIVVSLIYLMVVGTLSPSISFIQSYAIIFVIFALMNSITLTTGNAFLSFRKGEYYFTQNLLLASRIPLLLLFAILGSLGIFFSVGFAYLIASVLAIFLILKFVRIRPEVSKNFAKKTFKFSSMNYLANVFNVVPSLVLPILVLNLLGAEEAAKYYIAFAIGNLILIIPDAISTSFFVEGSHGINLKRGATKALVGIYGLLVPAVLFIYFFGAFLLGLFGEDYVEALELLRILAFSSFFVVIYTLFIPVQNIRMRVESVVFINLIKFVLLLGLSYVFILRFGIVGVGWAWMITYGILGLGIVELVKREQWI